MKRLVQDHEEKHQIYIYDVTKVSSRSRREKHEISWIGIEGVHGEVRALSSGRSSGKIQASLKTMWIIVLFYPQEELRDYEDLISKGVYSAQKARLNAIRIMIHTFNKLLCRSSSQNEKQYIYKFSDF